MGATIVIPLQNAGTALMPMLHNLVSTTKEGDYEVIFVERGSSDGTKSVLQQLDGDLAIIDGDSSLTIGAGVNRALMQARGDVLVVAGTNAHFSPGWLDTLSRVLESEPVAMLPTVPASDLLALRVDVLRNLGGLDDSAADHVVMDEYLGRVSKLIEHAHRVNALGLPGDLLGPRTGEAIAELLIAGQDGAAIGELPFDHAERLRERLWQEEERRLLLLARGDRDVCWTDEGVAEPKVTVRIVTHNRAEELMEIALPSALNQTYENLDILVVGDHTDDATIRAMKSVRDERVRFFNLPAPSIYPTDLWGWWQVHGSQAMNLGIELAEGSWINPADDDDEMTPDHVEVLLREARERRLEFVWSKTLMKSPEGWQIIGAEPYGPEATTAGAIMWSSGLRFMRMSTTCWKFREPHDMNMWRRMHEIGVHMGFVDHITYRYFPAVH